MNEDYYENELRKDFDKLDTLNSQAEISNDNELNSIVDQMSEAITKTEKTVKDYNIYNNLNNKNDQTKTKDIQKKLYLIGKNLNLWLTKKIQLLIKKIYKSMYDKSDVNENYKNYLMKRKLKLKELNPLCEDPIFKVSAENEKMKKEEEEKKKKEEEEKKKKEEEEKKKSCLVPKKTEYEIKKYIN